MSLWEIVKRMRGLDKRIVAAKEEIENIKNEALKNNRFSAFDFDATKDFLERCEELNDFEKYKFFYDICMNIEKANKLSIEDGEFINKLMQDDNNVAAIHRGYVGKIDMEDDIPTNINLQSIMNDGLKNNGHVMHGGIQNSPSLTLTTKPLKDLTGLMNFFAPYNGNNVIVILLFPKALVDEHLDFVKDEYREKVYKIEYDKCHIKPEYIIGAIIKGEEQDKFYTRDELSKNKNKEK